jgi:hypothetical protein
LPSQYHRFTKLEIAFELLKLDGVTSPTAWVLQYCAKLRYKAKEKERTKERKKRKEKKRKG